MLMCLFIECAPGYYNSSSSCSHPQSSLPFCFWPHLLPCPPLLSAVFFPPSPIIPAFITHTLLAVPFVSPPSFASPPFYSDHSLSFQPPLLPLDRLLFLPLSFPRRPSIPLPSAVTDQGRADSSVICICWASCHPALFCQTCNKMPLLLLIHG